MRYGRNIMKGFAGYIPGEQPRTSGVVKLNTNENPYPPSPKVLEAIQSLSADAVARYPDAVSLELREVCAERYGYESADWVMAGNGMDELLSLAFRTFVDPGDAVLSVYPTYVIYEALARIAGVDVISADLDEGFQLPEAMYSEFARICFVPRPHAPSGVAFPREAVARLCETFSGIVIIDEAYVDFADDTCMDFPKQYENAIVMRTFSKSFSLAGLRVGIAVARPELIAEFFKTKDSYNLNVVSQAAAVAAMSDYAHMEANVAKIRATRERLTQALQGLGFDVAPSQTNFVLARRTASPSARELYAKLREQEIYVRYFDERGLEDALRISIGTDDEIDTFLTALRGILEKS